MKRTLLASTIALPGLFSVGLFSVGLFSVGLFSMGFFSQVSAQTPSPAGAQVYFVNIQDGATVLSPVKIVMGLSGMGVAPAGVEKANTGHHHILIDRAPLGKAKGGAAEFLENLPADDNHRHFGNGQTEMLLELKPGAHTLQLVLGDQNHIPHNPPVMSQQITITVK